MQEEQDLSPEVWKIYGYCILQKAASNEEWTIQTSEEYIISLPMNRS